MKRFLFLLSAFLFISAPSHALEFVPQCDMAQSTADVMQCLNTQKTQLQDQLQTAYESIFEDQSDGHQDLFRQSQQSWLEWRDAQCAWEQQKAENESLKRVEDLACSVRLTADRLRYLANENLAENNTPPEFGLFPRWMNVVTGENPDVYWDHASRTQADVDCDGMDEFILTGIRYVNDNNVPSLNALLAIAQNPQTGRPSAILLSVPVRMTEADANQDGFCSLPAYVAIEELPIDETVQDEPQCRAKLSFFDAQCADYVLEYDHNDYSLKDNAISDPQE